MTSWRRSFSAFAPFLLLASTGRSGAADPKVEFARDVQPVFAEFCVRCHGVGDPKDSKKGPAGGLRLDDKAAFLKGGKSGKAVVPGKSKESLLSKLLQGPAKAGGREIPGMPRAMPGQEFKPIDAARIELIKKWIDQGAKWEEKPVDFAKDVQPILAESCTRCHGAPGAQGKGAKKGPGGPSGNLRLDDRAAVLRGGKSGKAVVPGKSADSLLVKLLAGPTKAGGREVPGMPRAMPGEEFKPIDAEKIAVIKKWIDQGAR
jgi:cytochrome c553